MAVHDPEDPHGPRNAYLSIHLTGAGGGGTAGQGWLLTIEGSDDIDSQVQDPASKVELKSHPLRSDEASKLLAAVTEVLTTENNAGRLPDTGFAAPGRVSTLIMSVTGRIRQTLEWQEARLTAQLERVRDLAKDWI